MKSSVKSRLSLLNKLAYVRKKADNAETGRTLEQVIADSPLLSAISYINQALSMPAYTSGLPANVVAVIPTYQRTLQTIFQQASQAQPNTIGQVVDDAIKMFDFLAKLNPDSNSPLSKYVVSYMDYVNNNKDAIIKQYSATTETAAQPAATGAESSFKLLEGYKHTSKYPYVPPELQKALKVQIDSALGPTTRDAMDRKKKELNNPNMTDLELYKAVMNKDYDPKASQSVFK